MTKLTLAQWRTALEGAATEIATNAFSFPGAKIFDPIGHEAAAKLVGAHIPVLGGGGAFDLALVASPENCLALSRAILYAGPEQVLRDAEVADAIGEVVNMLAGSVKRRMNGVDLELGLPIFLHGYIQPTDRLLVTAFPTRFGTIETMVLITGQK
ncbi:MAG TPA: chemotaxis protein CheX [Kofleriaceae bacterium]